MFGTGCVGVAPDGQARGSQGASEGFTAEGVEISPEAGEVVGVVVATGAVVDVAGAAGALTLNWVPVTTVTFAPSATRLGS